MAHMVYKKPLQNQSTRENYIKQRQELRRAKEEGIIDVQTYENAKKNLLPETPTVVSNNPSFSPAVEADSRLSQADSTSSSSSTRSSIHAPAPVEKKKGTLLDRSNVSHVARGAYKADSQTEEEREARKALRKAQKAQDLADRMARSQSHDGSILGGDLLAPYSMPLPTRTSTVQSTATSDSSTSARSTKSSSQRINFNIFRKRSASSSQPPMPLLDAPPIPLLLQERPPIDTSQRPGSAETSSTAQSSITRRNTETQRRRGGSAILDAMPMSFADIFLFGPPPGAKSRSSSRRHSFSSQNARPSFSSSRRSAEAPLELVGLRKAREEFVFQSRPSSSQLRSDSPQELEAVSPRVQPRPIMSTVLQDTFISLLNDFANNSTLFSYPKCGKVRRNSYSSSFRSRTSSAKIDEHEEEEGEIGKAIGGEGSWLIDESTLTMKAVLEKRVWFLMAMKWLSFGRVLFSPGHHIIEMSNDVGVGGRRPETSILDLDGVVTADRSWHLAEEYPFATIYNVLLPHSPRPPRNSTAPPNIQFITTTTLTNLSALPSNSIDVVTSHNLPRLLLRDKNQSPEALATLLTAIIRECARVLKPLGYLEITVVDPVMNNMGPRTRGWITKNLAPMHNIRPTKLVLTALEQLGGKGPGTLFDEVKECWVWMPTTSIGDELSTVTSMVGRHLYDELFAPDGEEGGEEQVTEMAYGVIGKKECKIWKDEKVIEECQKENTAFRWLKCYARKV